MAGTKYIVNQVENINYDTKSELKVKDKELVGPFSINNLYNSSVDFIDLHFYDLHWFVFNVADIFITIGVFCLILVELFLNNKNINEKN